VLLPASEKTSGATVIAKTSEMAALPLSLKIVNLAALPLPLNNIEISGTTVITQYW